MIPDLQRLASEYFHVRPSTPFTAHDAIAVAILRGRQGQRAPVQQYIETAWQALVAALALPNAEESARALCSEAAFVQSPLFERFEPMVFGNLLRVRRSVLRLANVHAGVLEGDPWGGPMVRDSLRPSLEAARDWFSRARIQVLEGLIPIDRAICAMLGWDPDRQVEFATLKEKHGWRELTQDEIFEQLMC